MSMPEIFDPLMNDLKESLSHHWQCIVMYDDISISLSVRENGGAWGRVKLSYEPEEEME